MTDFRLGGTYYGVHNGKVGAASELHLVLNSPLSGLVPVAENRLIVLY